MRYPLKIAATIFTVAAVSAAATETLANSPATIPFIPTGISQSASSVGFADSDVFGMNPADINHTFDLMAETGVHSVRIIIPWAGVEPSQGNFDWGQVDTVVGAANAHRMSVVGALVATPAWAVAPGAQPISGPPASAEAYGDFAGAVASHFRGRVDAYEIWNEPNAVMSWTSGPQGPQPDVYAGLLKASYPKIKAADRGAVVIGGVVGAVVSFFALTMDPVTFVQKMYAAGAAGSFDALSFHPYHYNLKFSAGAGVPNSPLSQTDGIHQAMAANGDGGKKIWATEYGEPNSAVDEATQADYIRDFLAKWRTLPYAGPSYIYTTRDRATGSANPEESIGVYRTDWTPKPAQAVVKSMA
ncbi:cellulase family glycosylhydrolase [Mycolicibacterium aubagnense]|uniref:Glycoside hydrolase family 5 domain-containing protein n=1 Tax=Mycolicibacterium aubagnense TaxID=319707 RepID=A0ABM7IEZ5_9MYCO|nr:cellulase family glycosylhydrolase [Mycolicibacterium aubagnense]TLH49540.1 hypothetical protein C1S80_27885 [Mycolicibacterium aubagnense]WGI33041.1 cellulase family glycosylhydrolase [Mycolicibacterium aubagnense]BBX85271.1 hypothetical protein MAUB_31440 [Mycolicibacterium aubagnense]